VDWPIARFQTAQDNINMEVLTCIHASSGFSSGTYMFNFQARADLGCITVYWHTRRMYLVLQFSVSVCTEMDDYGE
jgi:hypothetical protein